MTLHQQFLMLAAQRAWLMREFRRAPRIRNVERRMQVTKELCGRIRQLDREVRKFIASVERITPRPPI